MLDISFILLSIRLTSVNQTCVCAGTWNLDIDTPSNGLSNSLCVVQELSVTSWQGHMCLNSCPCRRPRNCGIWQYKAIILKLKMRQLKKLMHTVTSVKYKTKNRPCKRSKHYYQKERIWRNSNTFRSYIPVCWKRKVYNKCVLPWLAEVKLGN